MTALAMDTHAVVKELKAAGFTDDQAEAVTRIVRQAQDVDTTNLATKGDIADTKVAIAETKAEILKWMVGTLGVQTVVIIGAVLAIVHGSGH